MHFAPGTLLPIKLCMPPPSFCAGADTSTACIVGQHDSTGGGQPRPPSILSASASYPRGATPPCGRSPATGWLLPLCILSLCGKTWWQKGDLANDRPLAKMRGKIWENGRKTKCRTNYPIKVQLNPCGLMVCVGFGNSSGRLRSLLNSL